MISWGSKQSLYILRPSHQVSLWTTSSVSRYPPFRSYATGSKDTRTSNSTSSPTPSSPKWGLFGDIHFDERVLNRVNQTADWIVETFKKQKVSQIICMGDVLNTREVVSVQALSSAIKLFDRLSEIASVHIILGNHDMNLKHSGKLSSLDILDMRDLRHRITLHRKISVVDIEGIPCVMFPYQENNAVILDWIREYSKPPTDHVAFAHLSLEGAVQRFQKDNQKTHVSKYQATSIVPGTSITPKVMSEFKRSFSGHFHHHHTPAARFTYVGAPMQHTYGDAGDEARGVVIYEPHKDKMVFLQNPSWDVFRVMRVESEADLLKAKKAARQLEGKFVSLIYSGSMGMKADAVDEVQELLLKAGALEARKTSMLRSRSVPTPLPGHSTEEAVAPYVNLCLTALGEQNNTELSDTLVKAGLKIIQNAQGNSRAHITKGGEMFAAELQSVTMENFLGVRGTISLNMVVMRNGVWFLTGPNGSGKSTLLEAVTWCLFDRFLRSDMKSDYAVNDFVKKNCSVKLDFNNGYSIERFRKHKEKGGVGLRICKDGKYISEMERGGLRDTQKVLESLLGITFETFTKSVVLGDNSAMNFLVSDSKRRRETIEELLEMGNFDMFLAEAREQRKVLDQLVGKLNMREEVIAESMHTHKTAVEQCQAAVKNIDVESALVSDALKLNRSKFDEWKKEDVRLRKLDAQWQAKRNEKSILDKWSVYQTLDRTRASTLSSLATLRTQLATVTANQQQLQVLRASEQNVRELYTRIVQIKSTDNVLMQNKQARVEGQLTDLALQVKKMGDLVQQGKCPTCQQPVSSEVLKNPSHGLTERRTTLDKELTQIQAQQEKSNTELTGLEKRLQGQLGTLNIETFFARVAQAALVDADVARINKDISTHETQLAESGDPKESLKELNIPFEQIESTITQLESTHSTQFADPADQLLHHQENKSAITEEQFKLKAESESLSKSKTENINRHNELSGTMADLDAERDDIKAEKAVLNEKLRVVEFWEKGFDKKTTSRSEFPTLRSYLLAQSVEELNMILGEYSIIIGSTSHLPISFNSELDLNEDFGKRSAGQRKRNDIAIMLALFELVRQRGRFRADFIMLDEVFDALDVSGQQSVQGLLTMLTERVSKVFVITHAQPHLMGKDANILQVSMTPKGTTIETAGMVAY